MPEEKQKKVLVVDDERTLVEALSHAFIKAGYIVNTAYDGKEALEKVDSFHPDVMLLDILMPRLDGISVLAKIRQRAESKGILVIILTNFETPDKVAETLKAGSPHYLVKTNFTLDEVVKKVHDIIQQSETRK